MTAIDNLEDFKLSSNEPKTIYYIPDFISEAEEKSLLDAIERTPKPRWTQLSNRRLQNWGGVPHPRGMIAEAIPPWLKIYTDKIDALNLFDGKSPNHVLLNEYLSGQGIMPHLDGDLFFPTITTINLGSHTVLNLYHPLPQSEENSEDSQSTTSWSDRLAYSLLLQPRSLLILKDEVYNHFLHGIEEVSSDILSSSVLNLDKCHDVGAGQELERTKRISLTIRHVPKTTKSPMIRLSR